MQASYKTMNKVHIHIYYHDMYALCCFFVSLPTLKYRRKRIGQMGVGIEVFVLCSLCLREARVRGEGT
jgi:hypothetical protein